MLRRGRILIVDDEAEARTTLAHLLGRAGFATETAGDGFKALGKLAHVQPEVVICDLRMPGMDGLELLARIRAMPQPAAVVLLTAVDAAAPALAAIRAGAAAYLVKPVEFDHLVAVIDELVPRVRPEVVPLRAAPRHGMIGESPAMRTLYAAIDQIAPARASVLLTGETGTGKELVAAALHHGSRRADGPFIKVHCAALAETLLESELFGHERGAFTGAVSRREGRFTAAHGGTLLLDEIGEISPSLQVKLLRFFQDHEVERVGGDQAIKVDVRVIAATHRDLAAMVAKGTFREDLFYRLNVVALEVPPLRDRLVDVPLLVQHFFERAVVANARPLTGLTPAAMRALCAHRWPGNVRELEHAIERAVVLTAGSHIDVDDLPATLRGGTAAAPDAIAIPGSSLRAIERHAILKTLEATGGSTSKAAAILEITARTIQYKLHEYRHADTGHVPALVEPDPAIAAE